MSGKQSHTFADRGCYVTCKKAVNGDAVIHGACSSC